MRALQPAWGTALVPHRSGLPSRQRLRRSPGPVLVLAERDTHILVSQTPLFVSDCIPKHILKMI